MGLGAPATSWPLDVQEQDTVLTVLSLVLLAALGAPTGPPTPTAGPPAQVAGPVPMQPPVPPTKANPPGQPVLPTPLAAPEGGAPVVLTLRDALALGLVHDRAARISRWNAMIARAQETAAAGVYQPQVSVDASASLFDSARTGITSGAGASATSRHDISLHVEQLIFDTAQGIFDIYRTRQLARAAEYDVLTTELNSASRIVADFYDALRGRALAGLAEQLLAQAQRQVELAQARLDAGNGTRLEVLRAQVAVRNATVELTGATNTTGEALARLRRDLGVAPGTPLALADATPVPLVERSLEQAIGEARAQRPSLAAAAASVRAQGYAATAASVRRWARLQITGSFDKYLVSSRDVQSEYVLGLTFSLPLWDGQAGRMAETQARAAWRRAQEQLAQAAEEVDLDVEQTYVAYTDATARLGAAQEAVTLAADSLQQTEESYRLDVASLLELEDARTEFARAEANRITAQFDRDVASINLRLVVGRIPLVDQAISRLGTDAPATAAPAAGQPAGAP
jgi:outer membrane protein